MWQPGRKEKGRLHLGRKQRLLCGWGGCAHGSPCSPVERRGLPSTPHRRPDFRKPGLPEQKPLESPSWSAAAVSLSRLISAHPSSPCGMPPPPRAVPDFSKGERFIASCVFTTWVSNEFKQWFGAPFTGIGSPDGEDTDNQCVYLILAKRSL